MERQGKELGADMKPINPTAILIILAITVVACFIYMVKTDDDVTKGVLLGYVAGSFVSLFMVVLLSLL